MTRRGTILRDTNAGPGLLVVDGSQHPFLLEGAWRGTVPPKVGMVVDVTFGPAGDVATVAPVDDSQLAREQAEQAMAAIKEKGGAVAGAMVARFGGRDLVALGALLLGWFVLKVGSFEGGLLGNLSFTFWQVLGFINSGAESIGRRAMGGGTGTGLLGIVAIIALAGPFVHHFWKDRRAHLCSLLPLLLMLFALWKVYGGMGSSVGDTASMFGEEGRQMAEEMRREMRNAVSLGVGFYVAFAASIYFALTGGKRFLASR
jgi:hypothetical protein